MLLGLGATVTPPKEDNGLANKHADSAGSETRQNTENRRNKDEADHAREGVGESTGMRAVVHVVVGMIGGLGIEVAVTVVTLGAFKVVEHAFRARLLAVVTVVALGTSLIVVLVWAVVTTEHAEQTLQALLAITALMATLWTGLGARALTHHAILGMGEETTNAGKEKLLEALGLAVALLPGFALGRKGALLDLSLSDEQLAGGILDEGDGDSVNGDGASIQVENGEADIEQVGAGFFRGVLNAQGLEGVANGHGAGDFAIFEFLEDVDGGRSNGREDLATVGQQEIVFNRKVEDL